MKSTLVNCGPWSVLKISGFEIRSALRSASKQNPVSSVVESSQETTYRPRPFSSAAKTQKAYHIPSRIDAASLGYIARCIVRLGLPGKTNSGQDPGIGFFPKLRILDLERDTQSFSAALSSATGSSLKISFGENIR